MIVVKNCQPQRQRSAQATSRLSRGPPAGAPRLELQPAHYQALPLLQNFTPVDRLFTAFLRQLVFPSLYAMSWIPGPRGVTHEIDSFALFDRLSGGCARLSDCQIPDVR